MNKLLLFAFAIVFSLSTNAQLAFDQEAPLIDHMIEVNKEWKHYDGPLSPLLASVSFTNDNERIAKHLQLVEAHLRSDVQPDLSEVQLAERNKSLDVLNEYWKEGRFPINLYHNVRQPYFIDHLNTACAVGHLMRESGHGDIAEVVKENMNHAYVREIPYPELNEWANENGFTEAELAWIQPGYPPSTMWSGFGTGTDSSVTVVYQDDASGDLYVGGTFSMADGVACTHVAKWNGSTFEALGTGLNGIVHDLIVFDGVLYAGGEFNTGYMDFAKWDGSQWTYSIVFEGKYSMIFDLHEFNSELYAAGGGAGFAGVSYFVKVMGMNDSWFVVGGEFDEAVYALGEHNGSLAVGGDFTQNYDLGGTPMDHVATYFGTAWWELGGGLDNTVHTLIHRNGALFAGGEMEIDSLNQTFGIAHIEDNSMSWETDIQSGDYEPFNGEKYIKDLVEINGQLYVGGAFKIISMWGTFGDNIAELNEASDYLGALAIMDGKVNSLTAIGNSLVMGGEFSSANFDTVNHVARMEVSTGINDGNEFEASILSDVENELVYVDLGSMNGNDIYCELYDVSGKQVRQAVRLNSGRNMIDISDLSTGAYIVSIMEDGIQVKSQQIVLY